MSNIADTITNTITNTYEKKKNNRKYAKHKMDMKMKRMRADWFKDGADGDAPWYQNGHEDPWLSYPFFPNKIKNARPRCLETGIISGRTASKEWNKVVCGMPRARGKKGGQKGRRGTDLYTAVHRPSHLSPYDIRIDISDGVDLCYD
jgi:hypothetical protein